MWWKTTEVYRVALPYDQIRELQDIPIKTTSTVSIFTFDLERSNLLTKELTDYFSNDDILNINFRSIELNDHKIHELKTPAALESIILHTHKINAGDFVFIEWKNLTDSVLVTNERTAFIASDTSAVKLQHVLRIWIFQVHKLQSVLDSIVTPQGKTIRHNSAAPQPIYDVLITVLNPSPELQTIHWDVRSAAERYIMPFLTDLSELSNFTLKSQWKYHVSFEHPIKQIPDASKLGRHFSLPEEYLPHIITSVEKTIGYEISNNPCIQLVVYVPPCKTAPLHIYKKNGEQATINNIDAFLSPKWGGIIIMNPPEHVCVSYMENEAKVDVIVNSNDIMQIMLYLLRKLVNIHTEIPINGAAMMELDQISPRKWELDGYLRIGSVHLLHSATLTLNSLIQLLGDINYIVINDAVGEAVKDAYENIVLAKKALMENNLHQAVVYAKKAFISSEMAFFDPSLLALLYFPDEQKYAIYIPLFLPIMIPVILSINSILKLFKNTKNGKTDHTEKPKNE